MTESTFSRPVTIIESTEKCRAVSAVPMRLSVRVFDNVVQPNNGPDWSATPAQRLSYRIGFPGYFEKYRTP